MTGNVPLVFGFFGGICCNSWDISWVEKTLMSFFGRVFGNSIHDSLKNWTVCWKTIQNGAGYGPWIAFFTQGPRVDVSFNGTQFHFPGLPEQIEHLSTDLVKLGPSSLFVRFLFCVVMSLPFFIGLSFQAKQCEACQDLICSFLI